MKWRTIFVKIDEWLRFASLWALFGAGKRMHDVLHVKWSEIRVYTSKYFKRERNNAQFSSISTNDCYLRVFGRFSVRANVFTTFCMQNGVKFAFRRRNILNGREITHNFSQNRRMKAICESLGLFWRWKAYALHSACRMEWNLRLNVVIS